MENWDVTIQILELTIISGDLNDSFLSEFT